MPTDQDRTCASLARAALFPKRMHRDAADSSHFPALLQLDIVRDKFLSSWPNASVSSVFPRHVVVVRNLADGGIQWNGEPDLEKNEVSFAVIPDHLSVTCSSQCDPAFQGRAYRRTATTGTKQEIVLCSDRILQKDSKDPKYKGVAKELPPKSLQAVEEVLAHHLVQVGQQKANQNCGVQEQAKIELQAAKAAECYFSQHTYEDRPQIKKGSRLQTGYSYLPSFLKTWSMNKCLAAVAKDYLVQQQQQSVSPQDAQKAVEEALKQQ